MYSPSKPPIILILPMYPIITIITIIIIVIYCYILLSMIQEYPRYIITEDESYLSILYYLCFFFMNPTGRWCFFFYPQRIHHPAASKPWLPVPAVAGVSPRNSPGRCQTPRPNSPPGLHHMEKTMGKNAKHMEKKTWRIIRSSKIFTKNIHGRTLRKYPRDPWNTCEKP